MGDLAWLPLPHLEHHPRYLRFRMTVMVVRGEEKDKEEKECHLLFKMEGGVINIPLTSNYHLPPKQSKPLLLSL